MFLLQSTLYCIIFGLYILIANAQNESKYDADSERNLWKYLNSKLDDLTTDIRPVLHKGDVLIVEIAPVLNAVVLMDEVTEQITVSVTVLMSWHNPDLVWNDTNANFSHTINIPCKKIWVPCVLMESTVSLEHYPDPDNNDLICHVHWDGTVSVQIIQVQTSTCNLDIFAYPFDHQSCFFHYIIWGYSDDQAKVVPMQTYKHKPINIHLQDLPEWTILSYEAFEEKTTDTTGELTTEAEYKLTLKRIPTHSLINVVLPTFVILMLSMIGLFSPSDGMGETRSEKISLGLSCLLTMSVLLLVVADNLPKSSSGSLLGYYLIIEFVLSMFATMVATKLVYVNTHLDNKPVPWWISCLACMKNEEEEKLDDHKHEHEFRKLRNMIMSTGKQDSAEQMSKFKSESLKIAYVYNKNVAAMLLDQCLKHFIYIRKIKEQLQTDGDIYTQRIKQLARVEFMMLIFFLVLNTIITVVWLILGLVL